MERGRGPQGAGRESPGLDFKRALSSKNEDIAKDIAAMTVNGGVLPCAVEETARRGSQPKSSASRSQDLRKSCVASRGPASVPCQRSMLSSCQGRMATL